MDGHSEEPSATLEGKLRDEESRYFRDQRFFPRIKSGVRMTVEVTA
jgi:hypothetical protein